jgi:hypothetical protein
MREMEMGQIEMCYRPRCAPLLAVCHSEERSRIDWLERMFILHKGVM